MPKVYILVRRDLPPSQRLVMACHALAELVHAFTDYDRSGFDDDYTKMREWMTDSKTLVVFGVENKEELLAWEERLKLAGAIYRSFCEPHYDNLLMALAIHPSLPEGFFAGSGLKLL